MSYLFPSQEIKQNVLLSSYLDIDGIMNFEIYFSSSSKAMADRGKREEWKYKNLNILRMKKAFSMK